jgi:hypothetical protein
MFVCPNTRRAPLDTSVVERATGPSSSTLRRSVASGSVVHLWQVVWHHLGGDTSLTPEDKQRSGMGVCPYARASSKWMCSACICGWLVHACVRGYPRGRDEVEPWEPKHKLPMVELFAGDLPACERASHPC